MLGVARRLVQDIEEPSRAACVLACVRYRILPPYDGCLHKALHHGVMEMYKHQFCDQFCVRQTFDRTAACWCLSVQLPAAWRRCGQYVGVNCFLTRHRTHG
jgi:hypothetical protein